MTAGERIFVDLLPDSWTGPPPALPAEVVRELAEARARRRTRAARAARGRGRQEASADPRPRLGAADLRPLRVRNARRRQRFLRAQRPEADAAVQQRADLRSRRRQGGGAAECRLDHPADRRRYFRGRYRADRRCRRPFVPRGKELHCRRRLPAGGKAAGSRRRRRAAPRMLRPAAGRRSAAVQRPQQMRSRRRSEADAEQAKTEIKPGRRSRRRSEARSPSRRPNAESAGRVEARSAGGAVSAGAEKAAPAAEQPAAAQAAERSRRGAETPKAAEVADSPQSGAGNAAPPTRQAAPSQKLAEAVAAAAPARKQPEPNAATVEARRDSDGLRVIFSFATPTPAAMFRRADTVWLVFDRPEQSMSSRSAPRAAPSSATSAGCRWKKARPSAFASTARRCRRWKATAAPAAPSWTLTFADRVQAPPLPLMVLRNITDPALANVSVPLANPGLLHRLVDPDAGDTLLVVTAPPPTRGFIKRQDFVELSLLESVHGVVAHPNSDDVTAEVGSDKVMFGRPGGLTLSSADVAAERATAAVRPLFDADEWRKNRDENFIARLDALIKAMAAPARRRPPQARLDLANFYMARGMFHEARGVTNLILSETKAGSEDAAVLMVHAVASILIGHPERGSEGSCQSGDRQRLRLAIVESAGVRAPGQMGGCAREVQERRIRDRRAAAGNAAHRDRGRDAGFARGEGLRRGLAAPQRARRGRRAKGDEARNRGLARPAGRGARPRQGCARRLQICREYLRPAVGRRRQAAGTPAAPEARRNRPGRIVARTGDTVRDLARRRDRGEDVGRDGADLCRYRPLQ